MTQANSNMHETYVFVPSLDHANSKPAQCIRIHPNDQS